jgi:hypothetical protein
MRVVALRSAGVGAVGLSLSFYRCWRTPVSSPLVSSWGYPLELTGSTSSSRR